MITARPLASPSRPAVLTVVTELTDVCPESIERTGFADAWNDELVLYSAGSATTTITWHLGAQVHGRDLMREIASYPTAAAAREAIPAVIDVHGFVCAPEGPSTPRQLIASHIKDLRAELRDLHQEQCEAREAGHPDAIAAYVKHLTAMIDLHTDNLPAATPADTLWENHLEELAPVRLSADDRALARAENGHRE